MIKSGRRLCELRDEPHILPFPSSTGYGKKVKVLFVSLFTRTSHHIPVGMWTCPVDVASAGVEGGETKRSVLDWTFGKWIDNAISHYSIALMKWISAFFFWNTFTVTVDLTDRKTGQWIRDFCYSFFVQSFDLAVMLLFLCVLFVERAQIASKFTRRISAYLSGYNVLHLGALIVW